MSLPMPSVAPFTQDFVREGLLSQDQLAVARVSQENLGEDLGTILMRKGFLNERQLMQFISRHIGVPYVSLKHQVPDPKLLREISATLAKRHFIIPLRRHGAKIEVAMANPLDAFALDDLKMTFRAEIIPLLASSREIQEAIDQVYASPLPDEGGEEKRPVEMESIRDITSLNDEDLKKIQEIASGPQVIAEVNELIHKAWAEQASDIHIEPVTDSSRVRIRLDGLLNERAVFPKTMHLAIVSRIKIMAGLDIAEHRIPQDGRVRMRFMGRTLDIRVSTCPTQYGEKVVLRLLSKESLRSIEDLGLPDNARKIFSDLVTKSHGIFLVCGPTGSGKSTTLYAALMRINSPERNIISIEDPIESEIEGVSQIAVNPKAGLTFANILRSVLRQDPDVIMIGEIRDAETAAIAVGAAITGHLVLSTIHTSTAVGAISRLLDLGIEPFLVGTALQGVMSQRLVRKICVHCREAVAVEPGTRGILAERPVKKAFRGRGCNQCHMSGYSGRMGIFELIPMTGVVRQMIHKGVSDLEIEKEIRRMGFVDIRQDGFAKAEQGVTTLEEVLRVTEEEL